MDDKTQNASRVSAVSAQSEEDELAAIAAEVDEDLEVLSARSGEVGERDSNMRSSSGSVHSQRASKGRNSFAPTRGFGLHVNLAAVTGKLQSSGNGAATNTSAANGGVMIGNSRSSDVVNTPTTETNYVAAPYTPRSPRSDAESAYHSEESENQPLPGIPISESSSMVMYGRPTSNSSAMNHIV